jgi:hypothetical protein
MNGRIVRTTEPNRMAVPIIGKIKIGEKRKTSQGKEYPASVDYFICDSKYESYFHEAYGDKPQSLEVIFISDDYRDSCNERYELRDDKGSLFGSGDGQIFKIWNASKNDYVTVSITDVPNVMEMAAQKSGSKKGWETTLTIRFVLPRIPGVFGMWQFTTKGVASSIPSIVDAFDAVQRQAGTVMNIPFDLSVEKVKSQKPGDKSVFPVVRLVPNISSQRLDTVRQWLKSGKDIHEIKQLVNQKQLTGGTE